MRAYNVFTTTSSVGQLVDIVAILSGPFVILDAALPYILLFLSVLTLTGNFAVKCFFDGCGVDLTGRYVCGALIGVSGVVLVTGLSSCHATTALIFMLTFLAGMAMRGGARRIAVANMATAATLVPVVIVS
jgi:hypothetical protein